MSLSRILVSALGVCAAFLLTTWDTDTSVHAQAAQAKRRRESHHRRRAAEPGAEGHPQLGRAARGPEVGHVGRHRHRSEGRPRLGLRALRRGHGRRRAGRSARTTRSIPIFKFDRHTGKVLANFGKGVMVTPHGIHVDRDGNVWIADFAGNKDGTKGHQVHKFSPKGEKLLSLGIAGKPGNADGQFNQPNDVVVGPDGSIYVSDGHDGQGMTTDSSDRRGPQARRHLAHQQVHARTASSSSRGARSA